MGRADQFFQVPGRHSVLPWIRTCSLPPMMLAQIWCSSSSSRLVSWLFRPLMRPAGGGSSEMAEPMGFCASARGELRLCYRTDETMIPMNQATITTAEVVAVARSRQHWQRKPAFIWFQ